MEEVLASVPMYTWGRGDFGQLANGSDQNISAPMPSGMIRDVDIVHAAANLYNTAFVTGDWEHVEHA